MSPLSKKVLALHLSVGTKLTYALGGKITPVSLQATDFASAGITAVDCSGYVKWLTYHASNHSLTLVNGSVEEHEWYVEKGLDERTPFTGHAIDGLLRVFVLAPKNGELGHTGLLPGDGFTVESHGGKGPDRREWGSENWMGETVVFDLYKLLS